MPITESVVVTCSAEEAFDAIMAMAASACLTDDIQSENGNGDLP